MLIVLALLLSLALVISGCGGDDAGTGDDGATTGDTIKVGVNYELSGAVATYGADSLEGFQMAIDEINEAGGVLGKQIELIVKDNKSDPAEATAAAEVLMTQDKVVASVGPATSGNFRAVIPVAEANGIPVISSSATADDDITVDKNGNVRGFVFRTCFTDSFQGRVMANYGTEKLDAKTAVIFADNASDYAKGLAANFKDQFESNGGTIVDDLAYVAGDKDFNAVLTSLKAKDFDVIFVPGYYEEVGLIIKQARELGIDQPILGGDGFSSSDLVPLAGAENVNDVYFSDHSSPLVESAELDAFIEKYAALNNGAEPNTAFVMMGYDMGMYLADAITRAGSTDSAAIAQALSSTTSFSGVTGKFSVDENHNAVKSAVVIKLEKGEQVSAEII
jgi:branched-chain amino acid transport system substrate-binding protein